MAVQFDPTPVRPRRRVADRLVGLGVASLLGLVALAVAKPWATSDQPLPPVTASPARSPAASASAAPAIPAGGAVGGAVAYAPASPPAMDWSPLRGLVHHHATPGIEAIVEVAKPAHARRGDVYPSLGGAVAREEAWTPVAPGLITTAGGGDSSALPAKGVTLRTGDTTVLALGVTMPPDRRPLDVRFWRLDPGAAPERVAVSDVMRFDSDGLRLFAVVAAGGVVGAWEPATYLVEMLEPAAIERAVFEIVGPSRSVGDDSRAAASSAPSADELLLLTRNLPQARLFTIDRAPSAVAWESVPTPPEDELAAWLASLPFSTDFAYDGSLPRASVAFATVYQPTGIGLRLPTEASLIGARLVRIAPVEQVLATLSWGPRHLTSAGGEASLPLILPSAVLFGAAPGGVWAAGTYRLDATWSIGSNSRGRVVREASWQLDLAHVERATAAPAG